MTFCKEVQVCLNNNLTTQDLIEKFGFSDECELKNRIIKMFPYKHDEILRRLKHNDKLAEKQLRRMAKGNSTVSTSDTLVSCSDSNATYSDIPEENTVPEECTILEKLRTQESALISSICEEETAREALLAHKHSIKDTLHSQRAKLSELESIIRELAESVNDSIIQLSLTSDEIEKINSRLQSSRQQLESIQAEIKANEKIVIYVLSDGSIVSDNLTLEAEESLYMPLFYQFSADETFEELTIKEVRQLAKLVAITASLNVKFDILFDSEKVEQAYHACR